MLTRNFLELQHGCTGPRRLAYTHSAMNTSRSDSLLVGDRVGSKVKATLFDNGKRRDNRSSGNTLYDCHMTDMREGRGESSGRTEEKTENKSG